MLAQIESVAWVAEAWLSRDGNLLVVIPRSGATPGAEVTTFVVEAGRPAVLLTGINRDTVLGLFADRTTWLRAEDLAALTAEEAKRVALRVIGRIEPPLSEPLRATLTEIVRMRFYEVYAPAEDGSVRSGDPTGAIVADAGAILDAPTLEALKQAIGRGYGPEEGED